MKRVLIVGKGFSGLTAYLHSRGYDHLVLRDRRGARFPDKSYKRRVLCNFSDPHAMLATVANLPGSFEAVMTLYENYVLPTSRIAAFLGLPGMPETAALACTDKFLMRQAFATAPEPISPDFALVNSEQDVLNFAAHHAFPLILKPANLVKSLLVTKSDTLEELQHNHRATMQVIDQVYQTYAPDRQPAMVIEEFLQGSMHTIAAFADRDGKVHSAGPVVDLQLARDVGFHDSFIYCRSLPSRLSPTEQAALQHCAQIGIRTLGMRCTPAHVEMILTAKGPRIVEIGARNGGYRERMYQLASGIDLFKSTVDVAVGQRPQLTVNRQAYCAVLELFPKQQGTFKGIRRADQLLSLPSCSYFATKASIGETVGRAADGYKRAAIVILHHSQARQLQADLEFINQEVRVEV